jgi:outer membrane immunogenic protein
MKKLALVTVAVSALLTGTAFAADMAARPYTKAAPLAAVYNWTGFYIGAQVGGAFGDVNAVSGPFPGAINQAYSYDLSGVVGGGHIGYNWQVSPNWVFGFEGDGEATSVRDSGIGTLGFFHETRLNWLASARARLGYAAGNTLLYVTGGAAFGEVEVTKANPPGAVPFAIYTDTLTGWTVGAGVEHMFAPNWTGRLEYRYTDLGETSFQSVLANSQDYASVKFHAVRAGISYKF